MYVQIWTANLFNFFEQSSCTKAPHKYWQLHYKIASRNNPLAKTCEAEWALSSLLATACSLDTHTHTHMRALQVCWVLRQIQLNYQLTTLISNITTSWIVQTIQSYSSFVYIILKTSNLFDQTAPICIYHLLLTHANSPIKFKIDDFESIHWGFN